MPQKMFRLTDEQICKLKKVSELRGCSQTDLIRGFIDSLDEEPPDTQGDTRRDTQEIHGDERSSGADSPAVAALIDQLAQTLALESAEQKLSRWQRLKRAWRG